MKKVFLGSFGTSFTMMILSLGFLGTSFCAAVAFAEVPNEINYQGRLREYGQPVTGNRTMSFKIYAISSGGVPVWSSGDVVVAVTTGTFNYALSPTVDWRWKDFWIETTVSGKILSPREKIAASVYALHSRTAEDISKTSGTMTVKIGDITAVSITTWTVDAGNLTVSVATPTSAAHATTKNYVESWLPVGTISMWGGSQASIPGGWLLCDGGAINRNTYARLFTAIGTFHGVGDGVTTFQLPNLRDRFVVGAGSTYSVGNTGGANTVTLAVSETPPHNHTATTGTESVGHTHGGTTGTAGAHYHPYQRSYSSANDASGDRDNYGTHETQTTDSTGSAGDHPHPFTTGDRSVTHTHPVTIANTGGGAAHENRPPYFALCYIIKI